MCGGVPGCAKVFQFMCIGILWGAMPCKDVQVCVGSCYNMWEFARASEGVQRCTRTWKGMRGRERTCEDLQVHVRAWDGV